MSNASSSDSVNGSHNWQRTSTIDLKVEQAQLDPLLDYIINVLEKNTYLSQLSKSSIESGAVLQYRLTSKEGEILDVAIKFLLPARCKDALAQGRFLREARVPLPGACARRSPHRSIQRYW